MKDAKVSSMIQISRQHKVDSGKHSPWQSGKESRQQGRKENAQAWYIYDNCEVIDQMKEQYSHMSIHSILIVLVLNIDKRILLDM